MPELEAEEVHLNLEQLVRQEQYYHPRQFLLYPFFESIVPSVPQLFNQLLRTPSPQKIVLDNPCLYLLSTEARLQYLLQHHIH